VRYVDLPRREPRSRPVPGGIKVRLPPHFPPLELLPHPFAMTSAHTSTHQKDRMSSNQDTVPSGRQRSAGYQPSSNSNLAALVEAYEGVEDPFSGPMGFSSYVFFAPRSGDRTNLHLQCCSATDATSHCSSESSRATASFGIVS
jgi:hypothetical protein